MSEIIITGYPRSGNTWLARLIADALDSPLTGKHQATPIGEEGLDRQGSHVIRQLHLMPDYRDRLEFIPDIKHLAIKKWQDEIVIIPIRDPRDIAVSCMHYWEIRSIRRTLNSMYSGDAPISHAYNEFMQSWLDCNTDRKLMFVRYEDLLSNTTGVLQYLFYAIGVTPVNSFEEVIERQSLENKKKFFVEYQGHYHPYNVGIQLKHLRRGVAGDWKEHFNERDLELYEEYFGDMSRMLGYE